MSQKWNLQDIRPANHSARRPKSITKQGAQPINRSSRGGEASNAKEAINPSRDERAFDTLPITNGNKSRRKQLLLATFAVLVVLGSSLAISALTNGAEVTVYPKVRQMTINADVTAYPEQRPGELTYELLTLEASGERQVTATGQTEVETQAEGQITIHKTTPGAERLIKNTRFESPEGLVYRIEESVVVPGAVGDSPGTIDADVFAESAGEEYNLSANTRFTIPGFEEAGFTELYSAMYAENQSSFTGGFSGPQFTIDESELAEARQSLQKELRDSLISKVQEERPANFKLFDDAISLTYEQLPAVEYGDDLVTIREVATLQVPIFQEDNFASFIANETIVGFDGEPVRIDNFGDISFTYSQATTSQANLANEDSLDFNLTGSPQIVWTFDEEQMKLSLVGMERTALIGALDKYPGIERGEAKIRPFWNQSFPKEIAKIEVIEVIKPANE